MKSISVGELNKKLEQGEQLTILDVREVDEREICSIPNSLFIPMNEVSENIRKIPVDIDTIVYCHHGIRSFVLIRHLENHYGFKNLYNLEGGINEWALQVDRKMARY